MISLCIVPGPDTITKLLDLYEFVRSLPFIYDPLNLRNGTYLRDMRRDSTSACAADEPPGFNSSRANPLFVNFKELVFDGLFRHVTEYVGTY